MTAKNRLLGFFTFLAFAMLPVSAVFAQGATNVIDVTLDKSPVYVPVSDYYSQVLFDVSDFRIPSDDNGRKQWGSAILSAFGLGNKTKSLTLSAVLTRKGQSLPPIPLITYTFDGKKRLTDFKRTASYLSPRWQLEGADPIAVTLKYHYSESITYNPDVITNQVKQLIPSDAIVATLGGPFVTSIASLTTAIFENSGSRAVNVMDGDNYLLPYVGAVGARGITYTVRLPDGQMLGTIKAALVVAPSLLRPLTTVAEANAADLKRNSDNVGLIRLDIGGAKKNILQELKGMSFYTEMLKKPSKDTVGRFCSEALSTLVNYEMTRLDRTTLVYQSLRDAGFNPDRYHPEANGWLGDCYTSQSDIESLTNAVNVSFIPPSDPRPALENPDNWPMSLKSAMGCWTTNQSGNWCQRNAPEPKAILEKSMKSEVYIGVVELASLDLSALPTGRNITKTNLLSALNGAADGFSCFARGLILTRGDQSYNLSVTMEDAAIKSLQIMRVSAEEGKCLGP